jgi:acyl-CoA dehydrogenase
MKQQMTSRMRVCVNDGMDVLGGAGICNGPSNFLANAYSSVPIAITVEGANILTRSLIQFGQGLTRSHPHLLHIIKAIQTGDDMRGFNLALSQTIIHGVTNTYRSVYHALFRSRSYGRDPTSYYENQLSRLSTNFALCSDFALVLGGKVKSAEFTSGRFADVLSNLFLGYAVLWHHKKYPIKDSEPVLHYAMQSLLHDCESAFQDIFTNFPMTGMGFVMRNLTFPTGSCYPKPSDNLIRAVAQAISTDTPYHAELTQNLYKSPDIQHDRVALILDTMPKAVEADKILQILRKEKRSPTATEEALIAQVEAAREVIIQVDSFPRLGQEERYGESWNVLQRPAYTSSGVVEESSSAGVRPITFTTTSKVTQQATARYHTAATVDSSSESK